jgi:hypothetical protein
MTEKKIDNPLKTLNNRKIKNSQDLAKACKEITARLIDTFQGVNWDERLTVGARIETELNNTKCLVIIIQMPYCQGRLPGERVNIVGKEQKKIMPYKKLKNPLKILKKIKNRRNLEKASKEISVKLIDMFREISWDEQLDISDRIDTKLNNKEWAITIMQNINDVINIIKKEQNND